MPDNFLEMGKSAFAVQDLVQHHTKALLLWHHCVIRSVMDWELAAPIPIAAVLMASGSALLLPFFPPISCLNKKVS